ncbi:MAG: rod shape-determining protein MreC [Luteolibacter sp.]
MKPLNLIALILFLSGAVWALTRSDRAVREIQAVYYYAISPFLKTGSQLDLQVRQFMEEMETSKSLEAKLQSAEQELGRLQLIEARFRDLEFENQQLRNALNFQQSNRFDLVAARVLRRNPNTWWQTIEIDVGANQRVETQLAVLTDEGLVGKIQRVDREGDRSSVLLLTDEKCQVSARVEGSPEVGILNGQRGGFDGDPLLRLRFLSSNAAVRPGQRVLTTGRGGIFQPDIPLGTIHSVEKGTLDSEALVRPSVNFANLGAVFVILSTDS